MGLLSTIGAASGRAFGFTRSAIAQAVDAYFNLTTLLLPGNGTNGAQNNTFLDSSTNNFTITRNGNTTQGTFSPFSQTGWSNYFDGTGDYLDAGAQTAFAFGTGSWTVEAWVYVNSLASEIVLFDTRSSVSTAGVGCRIATDGTLSYSGSANNALTTSAITTNTWNHIAWVYDGTTLSGYINGVREGTATPSFNISQNNGVIGRVGFSAAGYMNGYISNLRVLKGSAAYSGTSFTTPTAPLTAITNTSLLTCQSNRFIDNSTNAFAITRNGDVSVQAFSPFAPTAAYSAATVGGSGYFDGTGDYLSNSSDTIIPSTGDFTAQFWIYPTQVSSLQYLIATTNNTGNKLHLYINSSAYVGVQTGSSYRDSSTTKVVANAWNHIACTRTGSTYALFVNGVSQSISGSGTMVSTLDVTPTYIAARDAGNGAVSGYLGSSKITTVVETISVPTAPYTSDGNTRLLTNFTNAGITDATAKNDLETVGNAQISTTQSKFGGSSVYFDGTGDALFLPPPQKELLRLGTGDFTIEFWAWKSANGAAGYDTVISIGTDGNFSGGFSVELSNTRGFCFIYDAAVRISASLNPNDSTWHHYAVVRSGSTFSLYQDGTRLSTGTLTPTLGTTGNAYIGAGASSTGSTFNGYIDDLRVTRGYARYTGASYTVPTAAFALQ